jgi:hypothetical protein
MPKNLPTWERALRACLGLAMITLALILIPQTLTKYAVVGIGVVLVLTSAVAFCPMCAVAGRRRLDRQ